MFFVVNHAIRNYKGFCVITNHNRVKAYAVVGPDAVRNDERLLFITSCSLLFDNTIQKDSNSGSYFIGKAAFTLRIRHTLSERISVRF